MYKIIMPEIDSYGVPLSKMPDCPSCGMDELSPVTCDSAVCLSCSTMSYTEKYLDDLKRSNQKLIKLKQENKKLRKMVREEVPCRCSGTKAEDYCKCKRCTILSSDNKAYDEK